MVEDELDRLDEVANVFVVQAPHIDRPLVGQREALRSQHRIPSLEGQI